MAQAVPTGSAPGDVFNKDTFLTSLREGTQANEPHTNVVAAPYTPKGMANVREKYAQLHSVVGSLSEKITAVLVRQEKDFMAAYRAHMYNVQKELHDTKEKILRNETLENKSEKIKLLEEERDWYRKEALRLDAFTTNTTKDLKHMKEKLECIEEDRDWLEKQLKASKKQNKLLRAELEIRLANLTSQASDAKQQNDRPKSPDMMREEPSPVNLQLPLAVVEREEHFRRQIRQLKRELQTSKREVNRLREATSKHQSSEMESFFLESIDAVKKDIVRRRNCGPDLKEFTSADRVRVIERLLSHDQVLSILYDNLFPSQASKPESPSQHNEDTPQKDKLSTPPVGSGVAAVVASREHGIPLDMSTLEYLKNKRFGLYLDSSSAMRDAIDEMNALLTQQQRCGFDCQAIFDKSMQTQQLAAAQQALSLASNANTLMIPKAPTSFRTTFKTPLQLDLKIESAAKNIAGMGSYAPPR
ncbi:unnamed protein product [Aphanomyces euteiches]